LRFALHLGEALGMGLRDVLAMSEFEFRLWVEHFKLKNNGS